MIDFYRVIDATHISLLLTNTSQNAPASNTLSAFTQIAIGFNGIGLLENQFGSITTNGINNALADGSSQNFTFTFGSSIGTFAQAQARFGGAQLAIHDQGYRVAGCSSKRVLLGSASGQNSSSLVGCGGTTTSVVPVPGTYLLMATGLAGIWGFVRRRRSA